MSLRRGALLLNLRRARLHRFDAGDAQPDWPTLRRLDDISLPDEWSLAVDEADTALLERHVTTVLEGRLGSALPSTGERLPSLDAVQPSNRPLIARVVPELVVLVAPQAEPSRGPSRSLTLSNGGTEAINMLIEKA